jgi:threonine dehydrogenase-like Zn-dependent dehydrogenase
VHLCERLAALGLMADGGLAEFCLAPARTCVPLPAALRLDHAALAETLSVGVHALRRGRLAPGETVAIVGAGAVGLCALQAALHGGARRVVVVEPDPARRRLAQRLGAHLAIDAAEPGWQEAIQAALGTPGPDLTVECGGRVSSAHCAIAAARRGGRIVVVGLPAHPGTLDFAALASAEKELIGSLAHVYDEDFAAAVAMLGDGRVQVEALITHRLPLEAVVEQGFERLASGDRSAIKILVNPAGAS